MNKIKEFETEIRLIKNNDIKADLIDMINIIPDYFFEIPAASSGKYHPPFAQGKGGLLRHTKFAVRIAYDLLQTEMYSNNFSERDKDIIIYSLIMHDSFKCGKVKEIHTRFDHPLIAAEEIIRNSKLEEKELIASMIKSHMGQWNKDINGKEVLPKPKTEFEMFVHMCDYLASRKYLDSKFIENEIEIFENRRNYVRS